MKKLFLISAIAISGLFYTSANAQIRLHVGINLTPRRVYYPDRVVVEDRAPVVYNEPVNYDGDEDYYYLPDVDAYYSVNNRCYYYNDGGSWMSATYLSGAYRDYDWRSARRYEVRAPRPYMHNDFYRARYSGVAFNGRWNDRSYDRGNDRSYDRGNDRGYVTAYRNDNRFENHNYGRRERNDRYFDRDNGRGRGRGRSDRDNHQHGRF